MIYYLLPAFSFLLFISEIRVFKPKSIVRLISCILILYVLYIGMFRGVGIGTDYYSYQDIFKTEAKIEVGFSALIKFVKSLGGGYQTFISFIFAISFLLKVFLFRKLSSYPYLSLMIYLGFWFLVYDMNGIRQGLSLGLTLWAVYFLSNNKILYCTCMCILSVLIHYSAFVFIPFIFLVRIQYSKRISIWVITISIVLAYLGVTKIILNFFITNMLDNSIASRAISYGYNHVYNANILFSFSTIHRLFIFISILYFMDKIPLNPILKNILLWASLANLTFYLLFSGVEIIATRLSLYYRIIECISLALIPLAFTKKSRILVGFIILLYVFTQVYSTLSIPDNNLIPYHSYMSHLF